LTANSVSSYLVTQKATHHFISANYNKSLDSLPFLTTCHADELNWIFGIPIRVPNEFTDLDRKFSLQILSLWTSFAKTGKMYQSNGKKWPTSNKHYPTPRYVELNANFIRERKFEFEERCNKLWKPLLSHYKR
jgi:carboxylesterase type B